MVVGHDKMAPGPRQKAPGVDQVRIRKVGYPRFVGNQVRLEVASGASRNCREGESRRHAGDRQGGSAVKFHLSFHVCPFVGRLLLLLVFTT